MSNVLQVSTSATSLASQWRDAWPKALAAWSKFTRLRDACLCETSAEAREKGLSGSFAMIRLVDQSVVIDLEQIRKIGLDDYAVEILAHEIGHHVFAPGNATDQFRLLARIRRALPTLEHHAPMVANLYTDLFINDRLQRQAGMRMNAIFKVIQHSADTSKSQSTLWVLYMRIYEHLWKLEKGTLVSPSEAPQSNSDAWLAARLVRVYAADWLRGAGKFATLVLPYLVEDGLAQDAIFYLQDTKDAANACEPYGAQDIEDDEVDGAIHPIDDPLILGADEQESIAIRDRAQQSSAKRGGQAREPFEYGEILKAAGIKLNDHEIAIRYYRERALPYLLPFPVKLTRECPEPQIEGIEPWEFGDSFDEIDWMQSLMHGPLPIPGLTTFRRTYTNEPGNDRIQKPVDLDMYVDSSGSMPNPQKEISYLALAGAIIALSALRSGARVQVTLWSGKDQYMQTKGFVSDSDDILRVLTGFYGGGTAFPIHRLRDTYKQKRNTPTHILMISDDGITTMFGEDEEANNGWDISARSLANAGAGGTMVLNLAPDWETRASAGWLQSAYADLKHARDEQGWQIHSVSRFEELIDFARAFSRLHYDTTSHHKE